MRPGTSRQLEGPAAGCDFRAPRHSEGDSDDADPSPQQHNEGNTMSGHRSSRQRTHQRSKQRREDQSARVFRFSRTSVKIPSSFFFLLYGLSERSSIVAYVCKELINAPADCLFCQRTCDSCTTVEVVVVKRLFQLNWAGPN